MYDDTGHGSLVNPKEVQNVLLKCFVHEVRIIVLLGISLVQCFWGESLGTRLVQNDHGDLELLDVISIELDFLYHLKGNTELELIVSNLSAHMICIQLQWT